MSLEVGIVGLPNAGKSTLFNALLGRQVAKAENYPFCTIDPNNGVVKVPDNNLEKLAKVENSQAIIPAVVKFVDIAGLVAGAAEGEGLGNKFLAHIRQVDVICYVLRAFSDPNVERAGAVDPESDFETLKTELMLKDLETLDRIVDEKVHPDDKLSVTRHAVAKKAQNCLEKGKLAINWDWSDEEKEVLQTFFLLTAKPYFIVLNIDEGDFIRLEEIRDNSFADVMPVCAKIEAEMAALNYGERQEYLQSLGLEESGLRRLIKKAYQALGLISFYTAGEKEARAWTVRQGAKAPEAAGVIHSDFEKSFIKAEVVSLEDFLACGGWKNARQSGKTIFKGHDYQIQGNEVVEFKVGN